MIESIEFLGLGWQAWVSIVITVLVFTLALTTKLATYIIFMGATTLLMLTGVLTPGQAIAGFSSTAVVTAGALFVIVTGMEKSGLMHWLVEHLLKTPKRYATSIIGIMCPTTFLSSFLSNTSVVAIMINVARIWCDKMHISPSKLLIPLSYAAGAGGAFTLIGSPSTLIIADLYEKQTGSALDFFAPLIPALCCFLICMFTVVVLRGLLPNHKLTEQAEIDTANMRMKLTVPADSPFVMSTVGESGLKTFGGGKLVELKHFDNVRFAPIPDDEPIFGGDTLYFEGGMTIKNEEIKIGRPTLYSGLILVAMVSLTLLNILPLLTSCMLAAFAMVICKCCTIKEGYDGINWKVLMVWAGSIALGAALDKSGVAAAIAGSLVGLSGNSPLMIMFLLCFIATFMTEFVSNTAAAALLFPIMINVITPLGLPVLPYTLALIIAVTCSFATPIGSPTHMLIYGPGGYTFMDFVRIGLPMNFIVLTVNVLSVYYLFM